MVIGIEFPFSKLSDSDFHREIGTWIYQCNQTLASKDLFADIIENPDKNDTQYEEMFSNRIQILRCKTNFKNFTSRTQRFLFISLQYA